MNGEVKKIEARLLDPFYVIVSSETRQDEDERFNMFARVIVNSVIKDAFLNGTILHYAVSIFGSASNTVVVLVNLCAALEKVGVNRVLHNDVLVSFGEIGER